MQTIVAFVCLCDITELGQSLAQSTGCLDILLALFRYVLYQ